MDQIDGMYYTAYVPWYSVGTELKGAPDSEKALVAANLHWAVEQRPIYVDQVPIAEYRANVRVTDGAVLGIVKTRYRVLQNREAFNFADSLLGEGVKYEIAGSLGNGRRVWILARMPNVIAIGRDRVLPFLCITNSHDGTGAVRVAVIPVQLEGMNTLTLPLKRANRTWAAPHNGLIHDRLAQAHRAMALTNAYLNALKAEADVLSQVRVSHELWWTVINTLIPLPTRMATDQDSMLWDRQAKRQGVLDSLLRQPNLEPYAGTAWAAVNAILDYVQHVCWQYPTQRMMEARMSRAIDGEPQMKKVLQMLGAGERQEVGLR